MVDIEIPDDMLELDIAALPGNWREAPAPDLTKDFGTDLLNKNQHVVIKVPSSVIPEEFNYLINPNHTRAGECRIIEVKEFIHDIRNKTG